MDNQTFYKVESSSSVLATSLALPVVGNSFEIVNPCSDFGFKKAFNNPVVLQDFLNHILDFKDTNQIDDLIYINKEFPSLDSFGRDFRVDIVCKTQSDRYFLIEMQNDYAEDYADKAYVEFARFLSRIDSEKIHDLSIPERKKRRIGQTEVGAQDFWQKIEEVCTLVISNKRFCHDAMKEKYRDEAVGEPDTINTYEMLNKAHPSRHLGNLEAKVVLVMLANFHKTADQLETDTDRWLFALKDESVGTGKLKMNPFKEVSDNGKITSESKALKLFYAELHTKNIGRDLIVEYEKQIGRDLIVEYEKQVGETNDRLEREFAKGSADGFAKGSADGFAREQKGEQNAALRIAKCFKSQGLEILAIAAATGLSADIITAL
jgi:hypothetical protein